MTPIPDRETRSLLAAQWETANDEARDLDKFQANWDGEGADSVSLSLIATTLRLLGALEAQGFPAPACVYPLADGTVMAEWHHVHGAVESANIRSGGRIEIVRREPGAKPTFRAMSLADLDNEEGGEVTLGNANPCLNDGFSFSLAA